MGNVTPEWAADFGSVCPVLLPRLDDVARYDTAARGADGSAALVIQPASTGEVRAVVGLARRLGVRLLPQGANTGLVGASVAPPEEPTVVVSTDRLVGPIDIDAQGATARMPAGCRLSVLNRSAAGYGWELPVDVSSDPCLGGMVATNTGGSRVLRYGAMRRHVLAATVVVADAEVSVFDSGSGLRKDSRGLDLTQVVIGSGGALGIVTDVTVALSPIPANRQTWWLALPDPDVVVELFSLFDRRRPGSLSAFELISANALRRTLRSDGAPSDPFGGELPAAAVLAEWTLDSRPDDNDGTVGLEADVAAAFDAALVTDGRLVDGPAAWGLRHLVTDGLRAQGVVLGHDVSVPRGSLPAMRRAAIAAVDALRPDAEMCDFGHAGDGGLHLNVLFPHDVDAPSIAQRVAIRDAIDDVVASFGGSYSAEHGLGPLNADRWLASASPIEQRTVAAVKAVVDPMGLLGHPDHPYNRLPR